MIRPVVCPEETVVISLSQAGTIGRKRLETQGGLECTSSIVRGEHVSQPWTDQVEKTTGLGDVTDKLSTNTYIANCFPKTKAPPWLRIIIRHL